MIGPQRLSLLDGEVLRREYSARATLDQLVGKLVDAFDFPINNQAQASALQTRTTETPTIPKTIGEAYAALKEKVTLSSSRPSNQPSPWSFPTMKKQSMAALLNEALCAWILNASPDGEKTNPLELGWSTRKEVAVQNDDDLVFHGDDQDERPLECNYTCMTC